MARKALRSRFLQADLGITGVNFAVAETGTLVLLENEGNIRMSTTLPRIHVAVMGLEKVVGRSERSVQPAADSAPGRGGDSGCPVMSPCSPDAAGTGEKGRKNCT